MLGRIFCFLFVWKSFEGATTFDMNSDIDQVVCPTNCIVIQNMSDWVPKKQCYLIVADELSFPGYVKLQRLKTDKPEPYTALDSLHAIDQHGRIVLRNTCFKDLTNMPKFDQHGPAFTYHEEPGFQSRDVVFALLVPKYRMQTCIWSRQSRQQTLSPTETCPALVSKITEISIRRHLVVIKRLLKITENGKDLERKCAGWMMRFINTSRWAHSVSSGISFNQTRFNFALDHLEKEPSPDLFSSLLKTAVIYHVIGDADNETKLLDYVGKRSSEYFGHVCRCWNFNVSVNKDLATWLLEEEPTFQTVTEKCLAFCVMFLPTEKPLTFGPLIYEFYRHVGSSKHFITDQYFGFWHECCVIDCFSLTLFLLYLKNKRNQKLQNAIRNLETLKWVILNLKDLGHRKLHATYWPGVILMKGIIFKDSNG
ncbi:unnamed protein product [Mytilus edulis]|uniref:Uncharacterized protein n=1 Tax=Mytilus edulis TaxID=6550 RepID=A0A8S3RJU5_MYTED|nr:unnamed protein product [Mytilus edulis]